MSIRLSAIFSVAFLAGLTPALAQQGAPAATRNSNTPIFNQVHEDWTVHCFDVRGPAPCDMQQMAANKQRQRVLSVSIAYIPQNDRYALQVVVPLGVAIGKGMTLNAGAKTLKGVRYNRCNREGCFVEVIIDAATVDALARLGASTQIVVYPYKQTNEIKQPMSLKGFGAALARLKAEARTRHVPSATRPGGATAPAPAAPAAPRPAAPAPAAPVPVAPTPAP
jgi:invasion protein IalB